MHDLTSAAVAALAAVGALVPSQASAIDLLSVYRMAQGGDPTFEASRYALEAGREKLLQARAGVLPSINLNGNGNRQDSSPRPRAT
ncbi:hypothetical protein [Cupriavidus necator]|uniref:hypothetical protein n=1 Tax=Cupriavidus necator TaxID=106590 RepID=UPI001E6518EB|nr:hypothetical protein [Cupriavidus necator]WKA43799.1 hypothetical protein QWP09_30880 [Cupriavidus necator]